MVKKQRLISFAKIISVIGIIIWALAWVIPLPEKIANIDYSKIILSDEGDVLRAYLSKDEKWRFELKDQDISEAIESSVLCLEDKRFFYHPGIDPLGLLRAIIQNLRSGRVVSGASTITMQLARLASPKKRTYLNKLKELFVAFQIELTHRKKAILKKYLTLSPYGRNIEGIKTASVKYFNKSIDKINVGDVAFLLMLPQSPSRWDKLSDAKLKDKYLYNLKRLNSCGVISKKEVQDYSHKFIPQKRVYFQNLAAHLSDDIKNQYPENIIQTTINARLQESVEKLVRSKQKSYKNNLINNVGVLVVDRLSRDIKVNIGNFNYYSDLNAQKLSSTNIPRSPGSTLKPILFAQLIERGKILPETLLHDIPTEFKDYNPGNFSEEYKGLVEASKALSQSLNVPFIRQLNYMGFHHFLEKLSTALPNRTFDASKIGLSIIVGSKELSLHDLVKLYTALANDGKIDRLNTLTKEKSDVDQSLNWLNPGAVYLTNQILSKRNRPDFPMGFNNIRTNKEIFWKTGTSQGRRDAWSIGFNGRYIIGVWLGNLDYSSAPLLTGSKAAAPLMFDIFDVLKSSKQFLGFKMPNKHLDLVEICTFSGRPKNRDCPQTDHALAVKGMYPEKKCPYHQKKLIDKKSGLRITRSCEKNRNSEMKTFLVLSQDILFWAKGRFNGLNFMPKWDPKCNGREIKVGEISILSPLNKTYFVPSHGSHNPKLPLKIKTAQNLKEIFCHLNGNKVKVHGFEFGQTINAKLGNNHLYCVDRYGQSGEVKFKVKYL